MCWPTTSATSCGRQIDGAVVADQPAREANQDRREGREPRPLHHVPNGRGGGVAADVRRHPVADRPAADTACAQHDGGCGQTRRPTVQGAFRPDASNKFHHHEAATDRFGRPAEDPAAYSSGRSRVQLANMGNIAAYVVTRIVLAPLSGQASEEFQLMCTASKTCPRRSPPDVVAACRLGRLRFKPSI